MRWSVSARWVGGLILAGLLASVVIGIFVPESPTGFGAALVAHASGMAAGYGAAVLVLLMARVPVLEHAVGADLVRWHALAGPIVIGSVLLHAAAAVVAWASTRGTSVPVALAEVLSWPGLVAACVGAGLLAVIGVVTASQVRRRLTYEQWHLVHLLAYVAVALGFTHQLAGPSMAGHRGIQLAWTLLYTYTFAMLLRYRIYQPLHQLWRHRLRVEQVIRESEDVVSIVMSGQHLDELRAEPGQFFRWRFLTPATWSSVHPFSLSAAPTPDRLRITVRDRAGSLGLNQLPPGTRVWAEGPYGALTGRHRQGRKVLLIAGGVGITPMRALFEALDLPGQDLTLIYRAASESDLLLREELDEIASRRGAHVIYLVGPSTDPRNQLTLRTLRDHAGALRDMDIYLCASPRLSASIRDTLLRGGFPRRQLHEERFAL
jgi:predicted ferric reductase